MHGGDEIVAGIPVAAVKQAAVPVPVDRPGESGFASDSAISKDSGHYSGI